MRLFRLSIALAAMSAVALAIRDAPVRIYEWALSFLASAFALFKPEPFDITGESWDKLEPAGAPLDLALQNGLRHEAHQHRRGAVRKT